MRAILPSQAIEDHRKADRNGSQVEFTLRALVTAKNPQKMVPMVNRVGRT